MKKTFYILGPAILVIGAAVCLLSAKTHGVSDAKNIENIETVEKEEITEDGEPFEARMARFYEHLFNVGFFLALKDCKYDADIYFSLIKVLAGIGTEEVLNKEFASHVADIDPLNVHKRVPEELLEDFLVGDNVQFSINFVISGYYAAVNSINQVSYMNKTYGDEGVFNHCRDAYIEQIKALK